MTKSYTRIVTISTKKENNFDIIVGEEAQIWG